MNDNNQKFIELREKYKRFVFESFDVDDKEESLDFSFSFRIEDLCEFHPTWKIAKTNNNVSYNKDLLEKMIFSLGMIELISYWKITCANEVLIKCAKLDKKQINWFKKEYINGLGEFFYVNGITVPNDLMNISFADDAKDIFAINVNINNTSVEKNIDKVLIPIGGGKDSAVSIEVLNGIVDRYCYIINPRKATLDTFDRSGIDKQKLIIANRTLDNNMLDLNKKGYLNGHTPFSAIVAFSSVIAAYINGISHVALSNESSANESTVMGLSVNHQYSKSFEFETDFRNYVKDYLDNETNYFSLLRPLTELGIARIFSKYTKYHDIFRSCNAGSKEDIWCGKCAKCLFVYIILSPFIDREKLNIIFGKDLLDDESLIPIFDKLIGKVPEKPFECVGERNEVNAALIFLTEKYKDCIENIPKLIKYYIKQGISATRSVSEISLSFNNENYVPFELTKKLKDLLYS